MLQRAGLEPYRHLKEGPPVQEVAIPEERLTVWTYATMNQFRIQPDEARCAFHIAEIVLLVPTDQGQAAQRLPKRMHTDGVPD